MISEELPQDKIYWSIGDVAQMFGVNTSSIRYWEQEFDLLRPKKNKKGDRFFTKQDLHYLRIIHFLLKDEGYTVEGAKKKLAQNRSGVIDKKDILDSLKNLRNFLVSLKEQLDKKEEPFAHETKMEQVDLREDTLSSIPKNESAEIPESKG